MSRRLETDRRTWAETQSGIPRRHLRLVMAQQLETSATACVAAVDALSDGRMFIGLLGPTGTGKTLAACWALWQRRLELDKAQPYDQYDRPVLPDLFIRSVNFRPNVSPRWQGYPRAERVPLLVLDDLGCEPTPKRRQITELLVTRYEADLPTIFTSALSVEEVHARYGDRISRRLAEGKVVETGKTARWGGQ